jgi:carbohydrate-selective porin OprB
VAPDIQVIMNPNADSRSSTAVVVGVNVKFSF